MARTDKSREREYNRQYYEKHKQKIKDNNKYDPEYYSKNKDRINAKCREFYADNKDDLLRKRKQWRGSNVEKVRNRKLIKNHNITLEQYNEILKNQNGLCAICLKPEKRLSRTGKPSALQVDHNHVTGVNRGLLCWGCNVAIGYLKEDILAIKRAAHYLEKHLST